MLFLQLLLKMTHREAACRVFQTKESEILVGLRRQIADAVCLREGFAASSPPHDVDGHFCT